MSFYGDLQSKASALLAKFGQDVTLRKVTTGAYNTATGTSALTNADNVLKGALFDFPNAQQEDDDTLVQAIDKKLLLQGGGAAPTVNDVIIIGGTTYVIVSVEEINPAGTPVLYTLHLRR